MHSQKKRAFQSTTGGTKASQKQSKRRTPTLVTENSKKDIPRTSETRNRALAALGQMRRGHVSLSEACRLEHIKPSTVRRYVGSAIRQDKLGGRFRATSGDTFRRDLQIPTVDGPTVIQVYGSKNARFISNYLNAVSEYLRTGKREKLDSFKGKTVKVNGKNVELITDPAMLLPLAEADVLHFDQLYASATGRG
ncbi:hypothetical protein [Tunturiibacter gelidoferens]|uniref:Uncharacterized protein n=1 Tax=Tunturiibacter gelidiferens TaxID=3069689 RepID=A0A9X0QDE5_9BACT|nr:hypothetical protein [Edaphobacter lichenicola]MBB5328426.1 hypothetical protein [Edaphobacter lichenicola]